MVVGWVSLRVAALTTLVILLSLCAVSTAFRGEERWRSPAVSGAAPDGVRPRRSVQRSAISGLLGETLRAELGKPRAVSVLKFPARLATTVAAVSCQRLVHEPVAVEAASAGCRVQGDIRGSSLDPTTGADRPSIDCSRDSIVYAGPTTAAPNLARPRVTRTGPARERLHPPRIGFRDRGVGRRARYGGRVNDEVPPPAAGEELLPEVDDALSVSLAASAGSAASCPALRDSRGSSPAPARTPPKGTAGTPSPGSGTPSTTAPPTRSTSPARSTRPLTPTGTPYLAGDGASVTTDLDHNLRCPRHRRPHPAARRPDRQAPDARSAPRTSEGPHITPSVSSSKRTRRKPPGRGRQHPRRQGDVLRR